MSDLYREGVAGWLILFIMKPEFRRIIALMLISVAIIGLAMPLGEDILCAGEQPDAKSV